MKWNIFFGRSFAFWHNVRFYPFGNLQISSVGSVNSIKTFNLNWQIMLWAKRAIGIITARKRSLRRLCFYRCLSVHSGGMHSWGGGRAWLGRGCAWLGRGHAWLGACVAGQGGMHGWAGGCVWQGRGACVAGGMHGWGGGHAWLGRGHAWLGWHVWLRGHAWLRRGACMAGGCVACTAPGRYYGYGIRSMTGRYASYWNAFLFCNTCRQN